MTTYQIMAKYQAMTKYQIMIKHIGPAVVAGSKLRDQVMINYVIII